MNAQATQTNAANVKAKAAKKKVQSTAAVLPMINAKKKVVFLKVVKGNADRSIEATKKALEDKKIDRFEGSAKTFVKENGIENITLWTSRIAQVQPNRVAKSAANQVKFWKRLGMTIINEAEFVIAAADAAETPVAEVQSAVDAAKKEEAVAA